MKFTPLLLLAAASVLPAQTALVTKGAFPYQVYQRDKTNTATLSLEGTVGATRAKTVDLRLVAAGRVVSNFDWKPLGQINKKAWKAELSHIPVGGPYRLEVRPTGSTEVTSVDNLLVGDLWVLAGQSNMEGVGNLEDLPLPSAMINSFDMTDTWVAAADPLHRLPDSVDSVHWRKGEDGKAERLAGEKLEQFIANRKKGAGVGIPFAEEMIRRTGVPIGLVPCAHGGTSMDQWSPAKKDEGGASLYGGMVRRVKAVGGHVAGVLWYQGESDANAKAAPEYAQKFTALIQAVRTDFADADLPFYYVQIGRHANSDNIPYWNQVQEDERKIESSLRHVGMTTCIDCELDDQIHVGTDSFRLLGLRLAQLAEGRLKRGPRPGRIIAEPGKITIYFSEVNGRLQHQGRLAGFTIVDAKGAPVPLIYRQRVAASDFTAVELLYGGKLPEGAAVVYGLGKDPYVNLVDEAQMPCPAFGPLKIN